MCKKNPPNQKYLFKYILIFKNHLGYGKIITTFINELLNDNDELLHILDNIGQAKTSTYDLIAIGGPEYS